MASTARGAPPTAEPPGSPRFEQHHHEQRPHGSPHSSPGGSLSAPHSTVAGASEATPGTIWAPSSPDSGSACSTGIGSAAPVWPARPTRPGVTAAPDGGGDESEGGGGKDNATALVFVDPELSQRNVDIGVEAGSGAVVKWICRSVGGGGEGAGDGREAPVLGGSGRSVDGQGQQQGAGSGDWEGTQGPALSGARSNTNLTVTIVSDEADEPQVTYQLPPDGECCEKIFDRPGSYRYYVCSGPLTMGRVVATAPKCQPHPAAITVASSPPACLKGSDASEEGIEGLAVLEVGSAKSGTAVGGHTSEVCASQVESECHSAATEGDPETAKTGDSPGQDQGPCASQEADAADILGVADTKQSPPECASLEGGRITAVDGHSSEVCTSQDEREFRSVAMEGDPDMIKAGGLPSQDQEPSASQEAVAADILDVVDAKQSPPECASLEGGQSMAVDGHYFEVCASQDEKKRRSATMDEGDPDMIKAKELPGQDQEPGASQEAVAADILDVAEAEQSPFECASHEVGQCTTVDGHSSEVCATQDEKKCRSAATEEGDSEMVKTGDSPCQNQEPDAPQKAAAADILGEVDAMQSPLECASHGGGNSSVDSSPLSKLCAAQDEKEARLAATEEGGPEMAKAGDSPGGQDQEPDIAQETEATDILDVADAKQSPLECASRGGGQCTAVNDHSSEVCSSQDEKEYRSAATQERDATIIKTRDSPSGQDQEPRGAQKTVVADVLDMADGKQSPLECASLGGGQCTAVDGPSSGVCASQDEEECHPAATEEYDSALVKTGVVPGQDQDHGVSHGAVAAVILDVADAKQSPLAGAEMLTSPSQDSVGGGRCTAVDRHTSEICAPQDEEEGHSAATGGGDPEMVKNEDSPGQDQEHGVSHEAVAADILGVADAKQSSLDGASLKGGQCTAVDGHSSEVGASQDEKECSSAATEKGNPEMVKTRGSAGQGQENGVSRKAVAEDILDVADAKQPPLEGAEMLTLCSQDSVEGGQYVDGALQGGAEDVAKMSAEEKPGAQSSDGHGAAESRVGGKHTPNHPPSIIPLSPVEGNSGQQPLQGEDQENLAPSHPSPSTPVPPETENSERSSLQGAGQEEQPPNHPSPSVILLPYRREPLTPGEGSIERLPLQGAGQDESSLTGVPEPENGENGRRNQPPMPPAVTGVSLAQKEGESAKSKGDDEVRSAVDHRCDNENGMELYVSPDDPDRTITPQSSSPVSIRCGTVDHVISQPSDGGEGSTLSDLAVFDVGGPCRDIVASERTTADLSEVVSRQHLQAFVTPDHAEEIFSRGGSGSISCDSDDAPRASCVSGGDTPNADRGKGAWEQPSSTVSPPTALSVPPTTGTPDRGRRRTLVCLAVSATEAGPQPHRSPRERRVGHLRAEIMQRDGVGQEWKEISPLTSPVVAGPSGKFDSFTCSENATPLAPPIVGSHEQKEQGSEETMGANYGVGEEDKATPSDLEDAGVEVVVARPLREVDGESEGTMQTAMEALDASDDDGSAKALCAITPSTVPTPGGAAGENIDDVPSDPADEAATQTGTAPNESEGTPQIKMEALDVFDGHDSAKISRAMSPSTVPPHVGAAGSIGDVSSDFVDEASAEKGAGPTESESAMQIAMKTLDVPDDDGPVKATRAMFPSTAPPLPMGADKSIGDVSSNSADEAVAETGTAPSESEGTIAMESPDVSDDDSSVKASRAVFPSTATSPVGTDESIGDISSDSADEAAADTCAGPNESDGTIAIEAPDISDDDGSVEASRARSPSAVLSPVGAQENIGGVSSDSADEVVAEAGTAPDAPESPSAVLPPVGADENMADVSSDSADETAAETGTAPDAPEGTTQAVMEKNDVSDDDSSVNASRARSPLAVQPPVGADENFDDVSDSADRALAETGAAPNESEDSMQTVMEALDVFDGEDPAKALRTLSPLTVPTPTGAAEDSIVGVSSDSADEATEETSTVPKGSEYTIAIETLDVSDHDGTPKASHERSSSIVPPPVGAEDIISDASSDSADEAAAETGTTPDEPEGIVQSSMEALDVFDGEKPAKSSPAISPPKAPRVRAAEENIGGLSSDSVDEAAAETGTAHNESEGTMQTAIKELGVSDGNGPAKSSGAISPSTAPPPMGVDDNIGDVSPTSADEAAVETGAAPNESGGTMQPAMEPVDVSDDEVSFKTLRAIHPSTPPPVGAEENISGFSSDSADEAAAETGADPNESEGTRQTAMEKLDVSVGNGSVKASRTIYPSIAPPPMGTEENIGGVSSDSADEAAAETGTAPNESDGTMQPAMEPLDVSDGKGTPKALRAILPSTAPPARDNNVGDASSDTADEAAAETGAVPAPPVDQDLPRFPTGLVVNAIANEADLCCESVDTPLPPAAVESSAVALENSAERETSTRANIGIGVEGNDRCAHTMVVGDDSMQPFQPEVVTVPVGARVLWKRCSGEANDDEPEVFNVRQGCPIVETGWRTEFSFSIGGSQPTFIGTFEKAGRFVISSDTSPPGVDRKRGEVVVESDAGNSESDSFASPDDVRTSSEGFASGNEGGSCSPRGGSNGGFGQESPRLAPSSMVGSQRAPQDLLSNSCGSTASDGAEERDCENQGLVAALPTEPSEDLHNSSTTAEPVHSCMGSALVLSGLAIPPYVAVTGTEMRTTMEAPLPTRHRPRSLPPISGARGMSRSEGNALSDGRGWVPPDRLSVLEWSKVSYVASETQVSPVSATSHECLRPPRVLSDPRAPAALAAMSGSEPSRGGGGGGGADSDNDCNVSDTDVDDDRQPLLNAFAVPSELRDGANIQEELFPGVSSACAPSAVPHGKGELEERPHQAPEAGGTVQVEYEEEAAAVGCARLQEDERTAQPPPKTSQSKKKKTKKKKKKSGGGGGGGGGGDGLGGDGGGSKTWRGSSDDTCRVSVGEDSSAMLLDEETFSELFGDSATGVGGGSGKTSAKTLIVGDRGFKPWKPVVVQVGATVSIKAANVWPNGGIRQDRALSISLVGPVADNEETRRFYEGANKVEDMPDESRFKKTAPSGRALVAVFRKCGEYWLIDHLAGKRIKVTAIAREAAPPVVEIEPGLAKPSGKLGSTSLLRGAGSAETTQRRGGNNGGEVTSRSKKKFRGDDMLSEVAALVKDIDAASAGDLEVVVLTSSEDTGSAGGVSESARDFDLFTSDARGMVDGGSGEVTMSASTTTVEDDLSGQALERAPSPTWLPPIRVIREGDLSLDDFAWFSRFDAAHVVRVSHKKGFEPATLQTGLSPGLGALVMCELDAKQRVTREVMCRWLQGGTGDASGAAKGRGGGGTGASSCDVAEGNDVETDNQTELSTRLGPGSLKKCYFVLGRFGEFQLSYRHDGKRGLVVVVKRPDVVSLMSASASNTGVTCEAALGVDAGDSSSQVEPPESPRTRRLRDQMPETAEGNSSSETAGEDGTPDSAEAPSDEDSAAMSGSTAGSAEAASHERCPIYDPRVASTQAQQDVVAEDKSMAVVAVGGGDSFCWQDAMPDRDQNQGDFVQQRSHVKRIKRQKVKSERAEAAKNAAAAAALLEAAAATAEAAAAEVAVGKQTRLDEAAVATTPAVPTGSSVKETGVPTATGPPADNPTPEEPRPAKTSIWETNLTGTSSQRAPAVDKVASSANSCLDQKPPNLPVVSAKTGLKTSASPGAAVVEKDALSSPAGESVRVEPAAAKPISLGRRKARKQFDGESLDSPRRSAPAEPVVLAPTGVKKTQRKREVGEHKSGGGHTAANARNSAGAKSTEPAQEIPVTEETVAAATGWGVAVSGASWSDGVGSTQSEVRAGVLPEGCNASRLARAASRPYVHQVPAAPPRVPHRRWDSPRGAAFSQVHAPPQSAHGRVWNAPISGGSATPVTSNWSGVSAAAPQVRTGDHSSSPSRVEVGGRSVTPKGGTGTTQDGHGPVARAEVPAEVPGLAGSPQTVRAPTIADSKENERVANQPAIYYHQPNVYAGRATASSEAPGVGGVGGLPGAHLMAGDRAADASREEGGGYGRRSRPGAESARTSSRASANSRSSPFSSSPSEPTPSAGSNIPAISKQKSKKKARAERKAANAAAGAVVGEAAFSGESKTSAMLEPCAGQPLPAFTKTTARSVKARKGDSQTGSSSRSGISFGDFVLPAKTAAGRAAGAFGLAAPGRRDVAGDRAPASTPGPSGRTGAGHGRSGEWSGTEGKKVAASGGDAKLGQTSRGRPGPAKSETAGGWGASQATPVLKPATAGASTPPLVLGDRPAGPPPYEQPAEKEEGSASEGGTVGNPETRKAVTERASAPPSGLGDRPARTPSYKKPAEKEEGSASGQGTVGTPETPESAARSTEAVASPTAALSPKKSDPPREKSEQPRWGNCSTKVSFEERTRRSQAYRGARLPRGHRRDTRGRPRPAAFPEDSRLPGGGYYIPESPDDRLPPPSAYEIEESARMMKVYDDMMERLNTTGFDEELPNGFRPKIYDLTDG